MDADCSHCCRDLGRRGDTEWHASRRNNKDHFKPCASPYTIHGDVVVELTRVGVVVPSLDDLLTSIDEAISRLLAQPSGSPVGMSPRVAAGDPSTGTGTGSHPQHPGHPDSPNEAQWMVLLDITEGSSSEALGRAFYRANDSTQWVSDDVRSGLPMMFALNGVVSLLERREQSEVVAQHRGGLPLRVDASFRRAYESTSPQQWFSRDGSGSDAAVLRCLNDLFASPNRDRHSAQTNSLKAPVLRPLPESVRHHALWQFFEHVTLSVFAPDSSPCDPLHTLHSRSHSHGGAPISGEFEGAGESCFASPVATARLNGQSMDTAPLLGLMTTLRMFDGLLSMRSMNTPVPFVYLYPPSDQDSQVGPELHGVLEPGLTMVWAHILKQRRRDGIVIDVGGNFGYYALVGTTLGHDVVTFEPVPAFADGTF